MQVNLTCFNTLILITALDRVPSTALQQFKQMRACQGLFDKLYEINKDFMNQYDALVKEKSDFMNEERVKEDRKDLESLSQTDLGARLAPEMSEKFKEKDESLDKNGNEVITFEVNDLEHSFVKMNFDGLFYPTFIQVGASRRAIIAIGDALKIEVSEGEIVE